MNVDEPFSVFSLGSPARAGDITELEKRYDHVPEGYLDIVREATNVVLLWHRRGELRIWGPEQVLKMDDAYGVSAAIPGAMPYADNGGGELLVHGEGPSGLGSYLVDTGSLFLDEDAPWIAKDLRTLLNDGEGAELVFKSDEVPEAELGQPRFEPGELL